MPPRRKANVIPSSPESSSSSSPAATPPAKARQSKPTTKRRVVDSDEEEEDELALGSSPTPASSIKPVSKSKPKASPPLEDPRRRSGRLSTRASSGSLEAEPAQGTKQRERKPLSSKRGPKMAVEEEDEIETADKGVTSEDEAESLLDGEEVEQEQSPVPPMQQHHHQSPSDLLDCHDRDSTPVPPTPSRQRDSPTPQLPSPAPASRPSSDPALPPSSPQSDQKPKIEGPQKRLIIHKMVLENFKSYAGRQEIGPFHKSFSAIVGPNGSGKSNTIDALLFVFGYRASKMRQGKLGELIHNSEAFPNLGYCKVEVWFKEIIDLPGPDAFRTVPNSSLAVARTAYKDNKSKYTINDRNSSYTEVTTLLKDRGIDLTHKRFLILQGEVESIAQMKPKAANEHEEGLLEYLEDIIGTSKYKTPIDEALVEVDGLNEVIGEKKGRLGIVVRELNGLKSKKREAEDFLRDQNELARRNSLLFQWYIYQLRSNIQITEAAITRFKEELSAETEANKGNVAEIGALEAAYNEQNEIYLDVKRNTEKVMKELASQEKREVQLKEKQKHALSQQKKLKKSINEDTHARSAAASWVENHEETIVKTRKELEKLEGKLEDEEKEFEEIRDGLKDKTAGFSDQIDTHQQELEPWTAKISEKQAAIDVATSERELLAKKATGMRDAVNEAENALERLKEGGEGKVESMNALMEEKKELEKQLSAAEKKLVSLGEKGDTLRAKVSTYRQRADEAKASLAASKGEDELLSTLNKMKDDGRLQGFSGRLGDLGKIDDRYDIAVTTACGGSLNSLICDTIKQGEAVIDVLRKRKLGRANIMGLDKLPARDLSPIETPENVPRLFDLITPRDARFASAFYKATGNTVVAENLEQANRIAYGKKRWRVVTLGGDLIDTSGAMSGGGTRVQRGGMSSKFASEKVEPAVVAKFERESEEAMAELTDFTGTRKTVEAEIDDLYKRIPQIEIAMSKIELDVRNGGKRVTEAEKRVRDLKSQAKPDVEDEHRIAVLDKEIAIASKEIGKLRSKSSTIEESIKSLQNQILEVGGVRLRSQKSKVDNTKQQIELAGEKITRAEVDQSKASKDAEKAEKAIVGNGVKLDEIEASLGELEGELKEIGGDLREVRETLEKAQEGTETMEEELGGLKAELDEKQQAISTFRARELGLKQKLEEETKQQKDNATKHRHWTEKHAELELQYIEEDDEEPEEFQAATAEADAKRMDQDDKPQLDPDGNPIAPSHAADPSLEKRKSSPLDLEIFSDDVLRELKKDVLIGDVANVEERLSKSKPNLAVLADYRKRQAEFDDRQADLDTVTANRDAGKKRYDDLRQTRHYEFMAGFNAISSKLKEMYQLITLGGLAELELVDSLDPFSEGIIFSVMPPKKSWKNISNLSGGEKTLSSLALVFALHVFKPTPLYFMDEIDAALDFRNVSIIANYIRERTKSAQFIIISLRSDMFELSHRLVGIYKTNNATKSVAIDNGVLIPA